MDLPSTLYFQYLKPSPSPPKTFIFKKTSANTTDTVQTYTTVPDNLDLILFNACVRGIAGAAQTVTRLHLIVYSQGLNYEADLFTRAFPSGGLVEGADQSWNGLYIPGGWNIQGIADFSAGVSSNIVTLSLLGHLIPPTGFV